MFRSDTRPLWCCHLFCDHLCPSFARLKQLEQEVVGGEQARNKELQQRHQQRKNLADQRKVQLIHALSENSEESENVLLNVYNSIQEEVHAKSQMLLKVQGKVGHQSPWEVQYVRNNVLARDKMMQAMPAFSVYIRR